MIRTQKTRDYITNFLIGEFYLHGIHLMPNHLSASPLWRPEHEV